MSNPLPCEYDPDRTAPTGYITATRLAEKYQKTTAGIRVRMIADHVRCKRVPRRTSQGAEINGPHVLVYEEKSAHEALGRPLYRSRRCCPGYIGLIARTFNVTRAEVRDVLAAVGIEPTQRVCPTCGKATHYYTDRPAAHAAMCDHMLKASRSHKKQK